MRRNSPVARAGGLRSGRGDRNIAGVDEPGAIRELPPYAAWREEDFARVATPGRSGGGGGRARKRPRTWRDGLLEDPGREDSDEHEADGARAALAEPNTLRTIGRRKRSSVTPYVGLDHASTGNNFFYKTANSLHICMRSIFMAPR